MIKHKRVLIQCGMFISDLKRDHNYVLENINKEMYNVYGPIMFIKNNDYLELLGSVIALSELEPKDFSDKISVYVGPALNTLKFDYIITVNKTVLDTQEYYIRSQVLPRLNGRYDIHSCAEAHMYCDTLDEAIDFLNEVYQIVQH
jgi:hypothetical protein